MIKYTIYFYKHLRDKRVLNYRFYQNPLSQMLDFLRYIVFKIKSIIIAILINKMQRIK